jgi:hypothetical protein
MGGQKVPTPGNRGGGGEHAGGAKLHYPAEYYREPEGQFMIPEGGQTTRGKDLGSSPLCMRCGKSQADGHLNPCCLRPCFRCPDSSHETIVSSDYHEEFKANR